MMQTQKILDNFKKFAENFPNYYKIKNPGFFLMTKYYIRKPTFKYLWFLFYKNPLRIITNLFLFVLPVIVKEFLKRLFLRNKKIKLYHDISKEEVIEYFSKGEGFLTISYCQKPLNCPDGRFSSKCTANHDQCKNCFLYEIKRKSQELGIDFYIVLGDYDSVWNILKNQFLRRKKGAYVITICNMVLNVIKYLSPLFGFRGYLIPFIKGECKTLAAYELSEFGYKNVQTDISLENKSLLIDILQKSIQRKKERIYRKKEKKGDVYEKELIKKFKPTL
ncbi:MAG: hypothetical protein ACK4GJ_04530 [bacterium]